MAQSTWSGNDMYQISLRGCLLPWKNGQPILVSISGLADLFLPLFSTLDDLDTMMDGLDVVYDRVKQISHPNEFFDSIPLRTANNKRIRIAVDIQITEQGTLKFREIVRYTA